LWSKAKTTEILQGDDGQPEDLFHTPRVLDRDGKEVEQPREILSNAMYQDACPNSASNFLLVLLGSIFLPGADSCSFHAGRVSVVHLEWP